MNHSRRRTNRKRRGNRKQGGAMVSLSPAPISYRTVSENPQPSERVMHWATTAGAPTPCSKDMQGVASGGRRRRTRRRNCKKRRHTRCKHRSKRSYN
jgi:hypothetical protein